MIWIGAPRQPAAVPQALRIPRSVAAVVAALVLIGLGTYFAGQSTAGPLGRLVRASVESAMPEANIAVLAVDILGEATIAPLAVVLLAVACAVLSRRRLAVVALAGPAMTGLVMTVLKPAFDRTIHGDNLSYRSGHTASPGLAGQSATCRATDRLTSPDALVGARCPSLRGRRDLQGPLCRPLGPRRRG